MALGKISFAYITIDELFGRKRNIFLWVVVPVRLVAEHS